MSEWDNADHSRPCARPGCSHGVRSHNMAGMKECYAPRHVGQAIPCCSCPGYVSREEALDAATDDAAGETMTRDDIVVKPRREAVLRVWPDFLIELCKARPANVDPVRLVAHALPDDARFERVGVDEFGGLRLIVSSATFAEVQPCDRAPELPATTFAREAHTDTALLRRLVIAWDADQTDEFDDLLREARARLGLVLADDVDRPDPEPVGYICSVCGNEEPEGR